MKARKINALVALIVFAALAVNSAANNCGWSLVGEIFGWSLIIGRLFLVVDDKIKEMQQ